jgi:hypothetical protein
MHQIAGHTNDLGLVGIIDENGGRNRFKVNIESYPGTLGHGWILLR